jgi:hypothetical protein
MKEVTVARNALALSTLAGRGVIELIGVGAGISRADQTFFAWEPSRLWLNGDACPSTRSLERLMGTDLPIREAG